MRYPHYTHRTIHQLDGIWDFAWLGSQFDPDCIELATLHYHDRMPVPGVFDETPKYAGKRGLAAYRTYVRMSPGVPGMLYFDAVGIWCRVYIDGVEQYEHMRPYSRFGVQVPPSDKGTATREIVVLVDNRLDSEGAMMVEPYFDFYLYGGIYRGVELHELPETYIENVFVEPLNIEEGFIRVTLELGGELSENNDRIQYRFFEDGEVENLELDANKKQISFEAHVPYPQQWTPESPSLHYLYVKTQHDEVIIRFGLRKVEAKNGEIYLNGKQLRLKGVNRHEAHPQFGPALPESLMVSDIQMIKYMGCNFIRGSHYPMDQRFLDLCDEKGILVWEESIAWQQTAEHLKSEAYLHECLGQTKDMIRTSYNHPSVIIWGYLNESASDSEETANAYKELAHLCKSTDRTRLVSYASNRVFNDLYLDTVDIISFNTYPGWYTALGTEQEAERAIEDTIEWMIAGIGRSGKAHKPFIISEIGAGAIYGWRDPHNERWSEAFQERYLDTVCRLFEKHEEIAGLVIWQYCDCRTMRSKSLQRPRSFNNKGLLDEYRRPKKAYYCVQEYFRNL